MNSITVGAARDSLEQLLEAVAVAHEPVLITGRRSNGILVGEEDRAGMQETLYLLSVPRMR